MRGCVLILCVLHRKTANVRKKENFFKIVVDLKHKKTFNTHHQDVAQIAQSVEQGIENPRVGGSIPPLGTTLPP